MSTHGHRGLQLPPGLDRKGPFFYREEHKDTEVGIGPGGWMGGGGS